MNEGWKHADGPFPEGMLPSVWKFAHEVHPTLEMGQDLYTEVFTTPHFFPLQRQLELRDMIRTARNLNPTTIMDIGSDKGGGLYHWCMCLPTVKNVIACEVRGTPYSTLFEMMFPNINFLWLPESSYDLKTADAVKAWLVGLWASIDVLFIDGDKSHFKTDFDLYLPMMRQEKSIVFMHDINDRPPREAFDAVVESGQYPYDQFIDTREYDLLRDMVKFGSKSKDSLNEYESWLLHWRGRSCGVGVIYIGGR